MPFASSIPRRALALASLLAAGCCAAASNREPSMRTPNAALSASVSAAATSSAAQFPPEIVQIGQPVLRARAAEVDPARIATPELQALIAKMIDVMRRAPGVGLAAPQIGVPLRVIVLEDRAELMGKSTPDEVRERERVAFGPRVFVNPVLRPIGDAKAIFFEGCLSVRGYVGLVERAYEVEVEGLDEHGQKQTWRVHGWPARILQHEVDHLDGTVYVDRMRTRSFANADEAKLRFAGKPIAEILKLLGM
jgi:peptide deformylase